MAFLGAGKQFCASVIVVGRHVGSRYTRPSILSTQIGFNHPSNTASLQRSFGQGSSDIENKPSESESTLTRTKNKPHKVTGKYQKKLHNRVFSEEEKAENEKLRISVRMNNSDSDVFGTLQRRELSGAKVNKVSRNVHVSESGITDTAGVKETSHTRPASTDSLGQSKHFLENVKHQKHGMPDRREMKTATNHRRQSPKSEGWSDRFGTLQGDEGVWERAEESLTTAVGSHEERFSDDEDEQESRKVRLSNYNRRHIPEWYGRKILKLGKCGQIREAIQVFDDWMLKEDRVLPNSYVFTCLITVLGRAGYTKKAFALFNQMKKMGIEPKPATYTALFNACANSPWKEDGRARADNLYRLMKEKEVEPTFITGKAMVKAFALCGDVRRAFSLVDELSQTYQLDPEAFSFLLMACVSDKEEGLRHAIQVWRLMRAMGVQPDLPLYNLLLRCVRDCGVGDVNTFQTLLTGRAPSQGLLPDHSKSIQHKDSPRTDKNSAILSLKEVESAAPESGFVSAAKDDVVCVSDPVTEIEGSGLVGAFDCEKMDSAQAGNSKADSAVLQDNSEKLDSTQAGNSTADSVVLQNNGEKLDSTHTGNSTADSLVLHGKPVSLSVESYSARIPDVLSSASDSSGLVSVGDLSSRESRLALLGGVEGLLARMEKDSAKPDVITFTQLLTVAGPSAEEEQRLLETMRKVKVRPDIDLVNALIHKRCMRQDFASAKAARDLIVEYGLTANQMTYGVLALTCKTVPDARQLLNDMEEAELAPSIEIMGALMSAAHTNFSYRLWVLQQIKRQDLVPHDRILQNIERALASARRKIVEAEKKEDYESYFLSPVFQESFERFVQYYETWLRESKVQVPRHPWAAFRSTKQDTKSAASA